MLNKRMLVLDKGYVELLEYMGSDAAIAQAARVSTNSDGKDDRRLIRYLMRKKHTSPFEMPEIKILIKAPIFVFRQMFRHRTANLNEQSLRYTESECEFYLPVPERMCLQSKDNRQGSGDVLSMESALICMANLADQHVASRLTYENLLRRGLTRELARNALGVDLYSSAVWKIDLHNLFHFLKLRTDSHAQWEIQQYAIAIENIVKELFPITYEAWVDYSKEAVTFSRMEWEILNGYHSDYIALNQSRFIEYYGLTQSECDDFLRKLK
jgi:thymidylate synthase (FAD)